MAFKLPWSNFHELNLDWILEEMKQLREDVDALTGAASPSSATPQMDGTGSAGSSIDYSRGDHRHPTDTTRASATDLSDAVLTLRGEIGQVDNDLNVLSNRVYFSSMAPSMDGTASAGQSDAQARADHTHPHDSAKADKDAFDTLKARVDAMSGAANPSDSLPEMDGLGSPGTGGNYSRGDHRHPSDTSKVSKAGDHMTGFLIQDKLQANAETSTVGWFRVATIPTAEGNAVRVKVARNAGGVGELHEITVNMANGVKFLDEVCSASSTNGVTKIRLTSNQGYGYLDIYITDATTADVGITLDPISNDDPYSISIDTMDFVDNAPEDETIVEEYTFMESANGDRFGDILAASFNLATVTTGFVTSGSSKTFSLPAAGPGGRSSSSYLIFCFGRVKKNCKIIMGRVASAGTVTVFDVTDNTFGEYVTYTTGTESITISASNNTTFITIIGLP